MYVHTHVHNLMNHACMQLFYITSFSQSLYDECPLGAIASWLVQTAYAPLINETVLHLPSYDTFIVESINDVAEKLAHQNSMDLLGTEWPIFK
jgi:hypothetical protein